MLWLKSVPRVAVNHLNYFKNLNTAVPLPSMGTVPSSSHVSKYRRFNLHRIHEAKRCRFFSSSAETKKKWRIPWSYCQLRLQLKLSLWRRYLPCRGGFNVRVDLPVVDTLISAPNLAPFFAALVQTTSERLACAGVWAAKGMFGCSASNGPQSCDSCWFV